MATRRPAVLPPSPPDQRDFQLVREAAFRKLHVPAMEAFVRPFTVEKARRRLDRLVARRRVAGEGTEASALWGKPSNFSIVEPPTKPSVNFQDNPPPEEGQENPDQEQLTLTYTEVSRKTHTKRVTNPEDAEQYVDVEVIDEITFSGDDNILRKFVLDNP